MGRHRLRLRPWQTEPRSAGLLAKIKVSSEQAAEPRGHTDTNLKTVTVRIGTTQEHFGKFSVHSWEAA